VSCSGETAVGEKGSFPYPYTALGNEIVDVSSRLVREKISNGEAWRYLVPQGVRCIIENRKLYGSSSCEGDNLEELIVRIENDVRAGLDPARFTHSRNTALMAWDLCKRFGLDPGKGYLAGIAHDMCKRCDTAELLRLAHRDGGSISKLEQARPGLLHARAAAVLIRTKYGVTDKDIIEAIRYHTTGNSDMGSYAKVLYVADKIEQSRPGVDPELREMGRSADLDRLLTAVLGDTVAFLRSSKMDISYGTRKLLSAINKRNKK